MKTQKLHELVHVAGVANPATMANSEVVSGAVDMSKYQRVIAILLLGNMAAETIDFRLETDTVSSFDDDKTTLVAATQLAAHASNNDNKQIILEARPSDLPAGHKYLRSRGVTGNSTGGPAAQILLGIPWQSLEADAASVVEIKTA